MHVEYSRAVLLTDQNEVVGIYTGIYDKEQLSKDVQHSLKAFHDAEISNVKVGDPKSEYYPKRAVSYRVKTDYGEEVLTAELVPAYTW